MTEISFYHLERQPLEQVLPSLLEKTRERGWRAIIRTVNEERARTLDELLWSYRDESYLPHALATQAGPGDEPIIITSEDTSGYDAHVSFHVDGASLPQTMTNFERVIVLFDGNDTAALEVARQQWKAVRDSGLSSTYWQQSESGRWEKKNG